MMMASDDNGSSYNYGVCYTASKMGRQLMGMITTVNMKYLLFY